MHAKHRVHRHRHQQHQMGEGAERPIAQQHIAKEARERTGKLDLAGLGLKELPPEVAGLTHLRELDLGGAGVADLAPVARLIALQSLDCRNSRIADLAPLAGLTALQSLNCAQTQVADLAPLAGLTALQSLNCFNTQVADLAPLARLTALQNRPHKLSLAIPSNIGLSFASNA